jgi:Tfp pilus assembly protein PilO
MTRTVTLVQHAGRQPLVLAALAAFALAAVGLVSVAGLVWLPLRNEAAVAEAELDKATMDLRELRYRARLAQDYTSRLAEVEALEAKLSQTKSEPEFVRDIEALATRTGVTIAQFSSRSAEQGASAKSADFEFFLNGSYTNLRRFIAELSSLHEFVAVERISLERNGSSLRAFLVLQRRHRTGP